MGSLEKVSNSSNSGILNSIMGWGGKTEGLASIRKILESVL